MKFVLTVFFCLFFSLNVLAQTEQNAEETQVGIEEIRLMRDDGEGNAGEETVNFKVTDIPIHCSVQLSSTKSVTVKMNLIAVKAVGLKPEKIVVTVSFKTNGKQDVVNFTASPQSLWAAGEYRAAILIDGILAGSREFKIQKQTSKTDDKNPARPLRKSKL